MKHNVIISGVIGAALLIGAFDCYAEKWDHNGFNGNGIESSFYDADSIKVQGKMVSWTDKYIYKKDYAVNITATLSKHPACATSIDKKGGVVQCQVDYQIEGGKSRGVGRRYYNKANELLCTDKDLGKDRFGTSWNKIERNSPMQNAYYDLVTRYHVILK